MKKKIIIAITTILIIAGVASSIYLGLYKQDDNNLTLLERQWIEENKNTMIDIEIQNDIPIFSVDGEGLIYDFLDSLEEATELEFNKLPYSGETTTYTFKITNEVGKNDILIYEDNYVLITNEKIKYNALIDISGLNIGVLDSDLENAKKYLNENNTYANYDNLTDMIEDLTENSISAIVLPKTIYLKEILENDLNISYNVTEMKQSLVLSLGEIQKLNDIIKKYYQKWYDENYQEEFNTYFSNNYYTYTNTDDETMKDFKSKRYKYGFITNAPYDKLIDNKLVGINSEVIKKFSNLADIEVTFTEYDSYTSLIKDFNENKIDFFFNTTSTDKYDMDVITTPSIIAEEVLILSNIKNDIIVNSLKSLEQENVYSITNTQIVNLLEQNNIAIKKYKNIEKLLSKINVNSIIAIDRLNYEMYKNKELKDFEIDYSQKLDTDYNYILRDIKDNSLFNSYFSFYVSFINEVEMLNKVDYKTFETAEKLAFLRPLIFTLFAVICLIAITYVIKKIKEKKKDKTGVSKENKLRYIDMMTSLKNRNYLNDSIEKWDESGIYPQSIIIIDLNNVAYINDNYGHNEGDNVIKEAANILIKNQLEQSEIIRTNGNEFLIYMVGYEEKNVVSYIRKLSKEFKELEHGFGAALGYSMINDGLKTIDDAINEATLDMRANKEEAQE